MRERKIGKGKRNKVVGTILAFMMILTLFSGVNKLEAKAGVIKENKVTVTNGYIYVYTTPTSATMDSYSEYDCKSGTSYIIKAKSLFGKTFKNWTSSDPDVTFTDANSSETEFLMADKEVTITANYNSIPGNVTITNDSVYDHVTITYDKSLTGRVVGDTVKMTLTADEGYGFDANEAPKVNEKYSDQSYLLDRTKIDFRTYEYTFTVRSDLSLKITAPTGKLSSEIDVDVIKSAAGFKLTGIDCTEPGYSYIACDDATVNYMMSQIIGAPIARQDIGLPSVPADGIVDFGETDVILILKTDTTGYIVGGGYVYLPTKHGITVTNGTSTGTDFYKGEDVAITAGEAPTGKVFDKWTSSTTGVTFTDATKESTTFKMVDTAVTVVATYKDKPITPPPAQNAGKVDKGDTVTKEGTPVTELKNTVDDLKESILTKEEKDEIAAGSDPKIYLEVVDITDNVDSSDKFKVEAVKADNTLGMYLDISLWVKVGDNASHKVTTSDGKMKISIKIPETLINKSATRTYRIVRIHDGKSTIIDGTYDETTGTFTFETDKFSTYALVYSDKGETTDTPKSETKVETKTDVKSGNPKTGDATPIAGMAGIMLLAGAVLFVQRKRIKK